MTSTRGRKTTLLCFVFSNFSVEMFYRNESGKEPFPLTVPGCQHKCPLQRFLELTDPVVPQDWEQECKVSSSMHDTGEPRLDQSVAEGESLDDTMLTTYFLPYRTLCGFGCVWIHSPSPYYSPLDCTLSHTVSAPWLPARLQWRRRAGLTVASTPSQAVGRSCAAPKDDWAPSVTQHSSILAFTSQNRTGLDFWILSKGDIL